MEDMLSLLLIVGPFAAIVLVVSFVATMSDTDEPAKCDEGCVRENPEVITEGIAQGYNPSAKVHSPGCIKRQSEAWQRYCKRHGL